MDWFWWILWWFLASLIVVQGFMLKTLRIRIEALEENRRRHRALIDEQNRQLSELDAALSMHLYPLHEDDYEPISETRDARKTNSHGVPIAGRNEDVRTEEMEMSSDGDEERQSEEVRP